MELAARRIDAGACVVSLIHFWGSPPVLGKPVVGTLFWGNSCFGGTPVWLKVGVETPWMQFCFLGFNLRPIERWTVR